MNFLLDSRSRWVWRATNQSPHVAPWGEDQPKSGECAYMADGMWYSAPCDAKYGHVCMAIKCE